MCQGRSADWPGHCHLMKRDGPKRVVSKKEKRCFWEGMLGVRVSMYVRCFHLIFYDHLAHPTNSQDCSAQRSLVGQVCSAFRRPELASRFAVTPWQSDSTLHAVTLHGVAAPYMTGTEVNAGFLVGSTQPELLSLQAISNILGPPGATSAVTWHLVRSLNEGGEGLRSGQEQRQPHALSPREAEAGFFRNRTAPECLVPPPSPSMQGPHHHFTSSATQWHFIAY